MAIDRQDFDLFPKIRKWAFDKGILTDGSANVQALKLGEEYGELCRALLHKNEAETKDAIGDMVVVLTSVAHLSGFSIEDCIESAYNVIKDRTGKMVNNNFIKNE